MEALLRAVSDRKGGCCVRDKERYEGGNSGV